MKDIRNAEDRRRPGANMVGVDNRHDRVTLTMVCVLMLFPAGFVIVAFAGLAVVNHVGILGDVPGLVYATAAAGLLFVGVGLFALTARTEGRSRAYGLVSLAALVTCIATGIVSLHLFDDGCSGSWWPSVCSTD